MGFSLKDLQQQGININQNPKGNQPSFTITITPSKSPLNEPVEEESYIDKISTGLKNTFIDMPIAMKKAVTGEDVKIEFPEVKEITSLNDIGFWEDLLQEGKLGAVRDDTAKAEVFENTLVVRKNFPYNTFLG